MIRKRREVRDMKKTNEEKTKARRKRATITRKEKEAIYRSMGLVKVRGSISGKIYWE